MEIGGEVSMGFEPLPRKVVMIESVIGPERASSFLPELATGKQHFDVNGGCVPTVGQGRFAGVAKLADIVGESKHQIIDLAA
jgi:hypothetical protein